MATLNTTPPFYTYRNGNKVFLNKETDKFVVRAKSEEIEKMKAIEKIEEIEAVSPASTRVTLRVGDLDTAMEEMRETNVTHHAYTRADNDAEFLVTDRILVTFRQPATDDQVNTFMAKYALLVLDKYSDRDFLFQLTNATGMNPVKLVVLINESEMDLIESCEHDLNKRMNKTTINLPTDPKYLLQWHLHRKLNNTAFDARSSSKCEDAWQLLNHFGSSDVVIGVTDDGCKISHTDFDSVDKFAQWGYMTGSSLISRDSISADPNLMYVTGSDHGTCCSGVIAAEVDGVLTVGAAPGCRLLPVKWQSIGPSLSISDSKMITVLNFIADKVDVLSNSWGSSPESTWASSVINKITQLAQNGGRRGKGIVFLWAAGNENCPIKFSGNLNVPYDNGYNESGNWKGVSTSKIFDDNLVGIPGIMHIAALSSNAQRSHYSNYGTGISVCAPSSNSHEYWRMAVTGLGILTTSGTSTLFTAGFGGTSSATPLVAGICGLVISANPQLTAFEVVSVIQRTAGKDLNMAPYSRTPSAPYDVNTAWDISPVPPFDNGNFSNVNHADGTWSPWFGFGVVNAEAAVAEALRLAGPTIAATSVNKTSSPGIAIPDNNPTGIRNVIAVADQGTISSVKISLDITHTFIGDLIIRLLSPRGTPVALHNRNGSSTKNINKTFDIQNTPGLSILNGEPLNGNWTLEISDVAAIDTGIFNTWTLQIGTAPVQQIVILDDAPGITIPDNNPTGIERSLSANVSATLKEIEIGIDITHSYIGDLIVNLLSPAGSAISLHNKTGASTDNIIKTFTFSNTVNLRPLQGEQIQGNWKLRISDVAGQDIGKLNKWSLKIIAE